MYALLGLSPPISRRAPLVCVCVCVCVMYGECNLLVSSLNTRTQRSSISSPDIRLSGGISLSSEEGEETNTPEEEEEDKPLPSLASLATDPRRIHKHTSKSQQQRKQSRNRNAMKERTNSDVAGSLVIPGIVFFLS